MGALAIATSTTSSDCSSGSVVRGAVACELLSRPSRCAGRHFEQRGPSRSSYAEPYFAFDADELPQ